MHHGRVRILMFLKGCLMAFIGLASGGMVAAGIFAFIVMIGVFTRLAARTRTSQYTNIYENAIIIGGTIGNIIFIYKPHIPLYSVGLLIFGLFTGIFVGCLAMALAEVLKVFPIIVQRVGLVEGLPIVIICVAAGKLFGAFIQFFFRWT